jgi:hypothetical protein
MRLSDVLEAIMLVCFGVAWPCATLKLLRSGRSPGHGLVFTVIILCGYIFGASSKVLVAIHGTQLAPVFWLYALNATSVGLNLALQIYFGSGRHRGPVGAEPVELFGPRAPSTLRGFGTMPQSGQRLETRPPRALRSVPAKDAACARAGEIVGHDEVANVSTDSAAASVD